MDKNSIETGLSKEQLSAVADLARTNTYANQSKWDTLRQLPKGERFPYFIQHFLLGVVAVVAAIAVVIGMIVFYLTRPPATKLYVASFGMAEYSQQMSDLQGAFTAAHPEEDPRVFTIDTTFVLTSTASPSASADASASASSSASDSTGTSGSLLGGAYLDDSAKLAAMMASGEINTVIATRPLFAQMVDRNNINDASVVLDANRLAALDDAVVYADDLNASAAHTPVGLDLGRSATWKAKGLPDGAILGFGNVSQGTQWPLAFVDFLDFR